MTNYTDNVFINIPFDDDYNLLKHAIVFTIYKCGFTPRLASEADDASENRIDKIIKIIKECKYGIHDLSRTELDENNLPRFNMPFEYGLFWGAKKFGEKIQKQKVAIVLERERYLLKKYLSDIGGADEKAHYNDIKKIISIIRNWLLTNSRRNTIPAVNIIINEFIDFYYTRLSFILTEKKLPINSLLDIEYCMYVEESIKYKSTKH